MKYFILLFLASLALVQSKEGFGPGEQEWGFVTVRPKSHMFWWLYYTTANANSYYDKPLVIWLQGGPGGSSTSFGNFVEFGPLDINLEYRNYTWVKDYNVLFIDNPVGTGFSYVTDFSALATTNKQIANDLVECMRGFFQKLPKFSKVATYIMTESYGGKMGAEFALAWYKAQKAGKIKSNLKGVGLGDAWISPISSVLTWAPYLLKTGMIDSDGYDNINTSAWSTQQAINNGQWERATLLWAETERVIVTVTRNIDFYNILNKVSPLRIHSPMRSYLPKINSDVYQATVQLEDDSLNDLMNGPVREALNVTTKHGVQSDKVFYALIEDFMKPVTDKVELLLNETDINVFVYSGQLDLIVDTPGTMDWVKRLNWKNVASWHQAKRGPLVVDNVIEGYRKRYNNFGMYWVNRAGHMVPMDNPNAMKLILEDITSNAH